MAHSPSQEAVCPIRKQMAGRSELAGVDRTRQPDIQYGLQRNPAHNGKQTFEVRLGTVREDEMPKALLSRRPDELR